MSRIIDIDTYISKRKNMERLKNKTFNDGTDSIIRKLKNDGNGSEYTPKQAAGVADDILKIASDIGYNNRLATPIVEIINGFGIDIHGTKNVPEGNAGVIYAGGDTKCVYDVDTIIFTDSREPFEHQRFVMAHELGHYLFDYVGNPVNREASQNDRTFEETYPRKNHNSKKEVRANRFAAELLMPRNLFVSQYNHAMEKSNNRIYTIKYLAKYFLVKETSIEKRIYEVLHDGGF